MKQQIMSGNENHVAKVKEGKLQTNDKESHNLLLFITVALWIIICELAYIVGRL